MRHSHRSKKYPYASLRLRPALLPFEVLATYLLPYLVEPVYPRMQVMVAFHAGKQDFTVNLQAAC